MPTTPTNRPDHRSRRAPSGPPWPIAHELLRPELVGRLATRWRRPVTLVVAGPGFGKSTALAQAIRANALEPVGVEAWVTCQPGDEQAEHLASAILAALDVLPQAEDPLAGVLAALRRLSPLDVSLILDDVHEIPSGSSSARLLAELVRRLPANAHLVLAGREVPAIPLAHLRPGDRLGEITEHELAFTATEEAALATMLGREPGTTDRFGGWPALVRLALAVRDEVAVGYAREEVLAGLAPETRRALFALACLGAADDDVVSRVAATPVRLEELAERVPLLTRVGPSRFRAHDLWVDALRKVLDRGDVDELQARAVRELASQGDLPAAGALAIAQADWDALARLALELVRSTVSVLPVDTASRWLDHVQPDQRNAPELQLLAAAVAVARDDTDDTGDSLIDAAADAFRARGDVAAETVSVALGTVAAQARFDTSRLLQLTQRATSIPGGAEDPVVVLAGRGLAAVVAEMRGDPEAALDEMDETRLDQVPAALGLAANRFRMHCLLLAGRADDAVAVADRHLASARDQHTQLMPTFARWLAGDPAPLLRAERIAEDDAVPFPGASSRDDFVARSFRTVIVSSFGRSSGFKRDVSDHRFENPRDAALITNARAARAVVEHDEVAAEAAFEAFLARHPVTDQLGERHLRRFLALGYVLDDRLRAVWDTVPLGPTHERARCVARAVVAARQGTLRRDNACDVGAPFVFTVLPLPWSIELACRLHGLGSSHGRTLAAWLVDHVGRYARDELRHATASGDETVARGAGALLGQLPVEPIDRLGIAVLGPLELRVDGTRVERPELRRARVRELLALLVAERSLPRDRAVELLWPDLDVEAGTRNLRVTLAHLRRLLEPERPGGEAPFHVRADTATVELHASSKLTVDLWELERLTTQAELARRGGDAGLAVELLDSATALWRGAPLTDLDRIGGFEAEIEHARSLYLSSLLAAGELRLTQGAAADAATNAERALAVDPYREGAHRLAIAANVQRHDRDRALAALARAERDLGEHGGGLEPATQMVMRHAAAQAWSQPSRAG